MKLHIDESGQVMLATAFLLAIVLAFIALMLNNVVYYNNISYMGFTNTGNDDIAIKNLVAKEAVSAYSEFRGDEAMFRNRMRDLANSLNDGTLSEGSYIVIPESSISYTANANPGDQSTQFDLTIYSKGVSKTYRITTTYSPPVPTPIPTPAPPVQQCKVTISSPGDNSIIYQGGANHTSVIIKTVDMSSGYAAARQQITLNHNVSAPPVGTLYYDEARTSVVNPGTDIITTGDDGTLILYWFPAAAEGTDVINASTFGGNPSRAAGNLSGNVTITNKIFAPCNHVVDIGSPTQIAGNGNSNKDKINNVWRYYVMIKIPITVPAPQTPDYNFSNFKVDIFLNASGSQNIDESLFSFGTSGSYVESGYVRGPGPYSHDVNVKLYLIDKGLSFKANITTEVSAYCNVHYLPYSKTSNYATPLWVWS